MAPRSSPCRWRCVKLCLDRGNSRCEVFNSLFLRRLDIHRLPFAVTSWTQWLHSISRSFMATLSLSFSSTPFLCLSRYTFQPVHTSLLSALLPIRWRCSLIQILRNTYHALLTAPRSTCSPRTSNRLRFLSIPAISSLRTSQQEYDAPSIPFGAPWDTFGHTSTFSSTNDLS